MKLFPRPSYNRRTRSLTFDQLPQCRCRVSRGLPGQICGTCEGAILDATEFDALPFVRTYFVGCIPYTEAEYFMLQAMQSKFSHPVVEVLA